MRWNTRNKHLRSEGHLFREEGRKHCSIQKLLCVSAECREQWLLLHKHLSGGRECSKAWKTEAPRLLTSFGYSWMPSTLKTFHFGDIWEHQSSFSVPLYTNWPSPGSQHHLVRTVTVTRQHCCITGTDIPSCCFLSSGFALRNSSQRWAQGSSASLFSMRLCPRSHFWLKLLSVCHPFQSLSIQTVAFMSLDSLFCFPKKQKSPENNCFISSVTQISREINIFNTFPLSCFLPLSSCLLLLTQAYFLIKRGRSYWKAA